MRWFFTALAVFALGMCGWWFARERTGVAEELSGALGAPVSQEDAERLAGCRAKFRGVAQIIQRSMIPPSNSAFDIRKSKFEATHPGAPCFYWTLPAQQKTVSAECQALRLNYALWPARVLYRDDRALSSAEYVLVHPYQTGDFDMRLFEYELQTGRAWKFKEIGRSGEIVVLQRVRDGRSAK